MVKSIDEEETNEEFLAKAFLIAQETLSRRNKELEKAERAKEALMTETTLENIIANPDVMIGLLTNLKAEQEARREADRFPINRNMRTNLYPSFY